jgi:hypothetical protein
MSDTKTRLTLGQSIDKLVEALEPLDPDGRKTALQAVCAYLQIPISEGSAIGTGPDTNPPPKDPPSVIQTDSARAAGVPRKDIRTLKEEKKPSTAREMACIVAYYLQEHAPEGERKDSVSTTDLEKYFKQANFKLPKKINQVLIDAKASGYFESASRGEYKLNAVGYNLVAHNLPKKKAD